MGFLGTGASMTSDIVLISYLFLLLPGMLLGFYFARRKKFVPHHKLTMTTVVILNWIFIIGLMFGSYGRGVLPYLNAQFAGDVRITLPTLHAITGGIAQLLATYLAIRMWFEKVLPSWIMVKRIKLYMRITLTLWIITVLLGVLIYVTWYVGQPSTSGDNILPAVTAEPGATLEPGATVEPGATIEPGAAGFDPAATPEVIALATPEIMPGATPEISPANTPEVNDDHNAARDAARATEDAIDDAQDAAKDAARATEDAIDDAQDAAEDAAKATEKAGKDD
jgi:uncharacterized membrane protein YozB (DUF420 family)